MNLKKPPLISFVVSVYNLERYVRDCLDSIVNQPFDDYEIVLVDNGSTDGSRAICEEYVASYPQIRYFPLEGYPLPGRALIHGAQQAEGVYLQLVDVDDMLVPGVYGQVEEKLRTVAPDVLFGRFETLFEDDVPNFTDRLFCEQAMNGTKEEILSYLADSHPFILATWRLIVKRERCFWVNEAYQNLSSHRYNNPEANYVPNIHFDTTFSAYTLLAADSIAYVAEPLYVHRVRASSVSRITPYTHLTSCGILMLELLEVTQDVMRTPAERKFVRTIQDMYYYQLCISACVLTDNEFDICVGTVSKYIPRITLIDPQKLHPFLFKLRYEGSEKTLSWCRENFSNQIDSLSAAVNEQQGLVYIAPLGRVSKYLKAILESKGISITAYFDNDEKKDRFIVDNIPVVTPTALKAVIDSQAPITIFIGIGTPNIRSELKNQFMALGVPETDLKIIDI